MAKKGKDSKGKKERKPRRPSKLYELYKVEGGKITKRPKSSPKTDKWTAMAEHKDRVVCGATGYTEFVKKEKKE